MSYNIQFLNQGFQKSIRQLFPKLKYDEHGIEVYFIVHEEKEIKISYNNNILKIYGNIPVHMFRGFSIFIQNYSNQKEFNSKETVLFDHTGSMIDLSRNSALNIDMLKSLIDVHAKLGLDKIYMYMEDVYKINNDPYFGHMRGAYSHKTLKELDDYAYQVGVELIPTIQTLAHLRTFLRWPHTKNIQDSEDILLVDDKDTLKFIDDLITSASAPFRTHKIHIGMDEADLLGLGQYLRINGYKKRHEIMLKHLKNVNDICKNLNLEVQIWSDMFFRLKSPTGDYYDLPATTEFELSEPIPDNIQLVYWDYYHHEKNEYTKNMKLHDKLSSNHAFAGGGWTWNGLSPNYSKARVTLNQGLLACKERGIKETFCTFWFDNGMETPVHTAVYSMILYSQSCFDSDKNSINEWVKMMSGYESIDFELLNQFDDMNGTLKDNEGADNPSKYLFYQDILQGLFDEQIKGLNVTTHYKNLEKSLSNLTKLETSYGLLFKYYEQFARVLSVKSEMGIRLHEYYHKDNLTGIRNEINKIDTLITDIEILKELRESIWNSECQIFGYEVLDIRYGGVITRLKTTQRRLEKYVNGRLENIPELEQERLIYHADIKNPEHKLCRVDSWQNIVSAGNIAGI